MDEKEILSPSEHALANDLDAWIDEGAIDVVLDALILVGPESPLHDMYLIKIGKFLMKRRKRSLK